MLKKTVTERVMQSAHTERTASGESCLGSRCTKTNPESHAEVETRSVAVLLTLQAGSNPKSERKGGTVHQHP